MILTRNGVNRVVYKKGSTTIILINLTADTVTPDTMVEGTTAHNAAGVQITGKLKIANLYTGANEPAATLGKDGDIYLQK